MGPVNHSCSMYNHLAVRMHCSEPLNVADATQSRDRRLPRKIFRDPCGHGPRQMFATSPHAHAMMDGCAQF